MFTSSGKWSSDTKCGGKRSGGFIDVNGGVSKGGSLIVTHHEYPSSATQRGGHSTGGSVGSGGGSYSSQEQHIQQVSSSLGGNVLGGAYHDQRKNRDKDDGINYQVKGIVSQLNYYGFKDPKGIVLSDCALEDRDISLYSSFVQTLQHHPFNLTIIDLSNNKLGIDAVEGIFYLTRVDHALPKHVQCINLSNNLLDDNCAEHIANYLKQGVHPSLKRLDVSGNNMSWESNALFAQAAINIRQDIKILINKVLPISSITRGVKKQSDFFFGSKEEKHAIIEDCLKHAQSNGIDIQNVAVSKSIFETIENSLKLYFNYQVGFAKCNIVPEDTTSFAAGAIVAKISKKATGVIAATDAVACYFEVFDENAASQEGVQFMLDAGIINTTDLLGNVE